MGGFLAGLTVAERTIVRGRRGIIAILSATGLALAALSLGPISPANADRVTDDFRIGYGPGSIAVNPVTDTVYVLNEEGMYIGGGPAGGRNFPLYYTSDVAVNSSTNKIYVSSTNGYVAVVDGATYGEPERIPASGWILAVNETNNKIYLGGTKVLTIIDGATKATARLPITADVTDIVVNSTTNKVYALGDGTITVVDAGAVSSTISIGPGGIQAIAVNPVTNKIYFTVSGKYGGGIGVIDGKTDTVESTIPSSGLVGKLAIDSSTNKVYVEVERTSTDRFVQVIDAGSQQQVAEFRTPARITDLVVNQSNNKVYAPTTAGRTTIFNGSNNSTSVVDTGGWSGDAAVNPVSNRVYIGQPSGWNLAIIDGSVSSPVKNDFNGDGKSDVLATDKAGVLWLYPGNGAGGWLPPRQVGQGWNVMTAMVSTGDFNGDGKSDVLARDGSGALWLYPGNGSGGWLARSRVGQGWNVMTAIVGVGDLNGDGTADIAARDSSGTLWLYRADGRGGWLPRHWYTSGWNNYSQIIGVGDYDGDGASDVAARDGSGALWWLYPRAGAGTLPKQIIGQGWNAMNSLAWPGDFNGDGWPDILARNSAGELWMYSGHGGFSWPTATRVGAGWNVMTAIL